MNDNCPLCHCKETTSYFNNENRIYLKCPHCHLVFLVTDQLLNFEEEIEIYKHHQNDPKDNNYQLFLNKLLVPMESFIESESIGIDYGCGPGPAISYLMEKKGHQVSNFDPYFFNDESLLENNYDFVTCTEVLEHVFWPKGDFLKMLSLLKAGGVLGIMTQFLEDDVDFKSWWYKNDPTHVRFYSKKTFRFLANKYLKRVEFFGDSVVIFF